jgi:RNA polymerase sigma factor (sigma-70 family)
MDDDALLAGCRRRDPQALDALIRRYAGPVRRVIYRVLSDPHDAEDAFQETFLKLADPRLFLRVRSAAALRAYVLTVARRRALDQLRRRYRDADGRAAFSLEVHSDPIASPAPEILPQFDEILKLLPDTAAGVRGATVLRLRYQEGLSYDEIAARATIPRGSIGPTIARALSRLAEQLARDKPASRYRIGG